MKLRLGESGVTMYVNSQDYTGEVWFNYNVEVEYVTVSPDTYILEIGAVNKVNIKYSFRVEKGGGWKFSMLPLMTCINLTE